MSSVLRPLTASASRASKQLATAGAARSFHSPYALLGESPLTTPSTSYTSYYEKQYDYGTHEPFVSSSGRRTYVVSEPDASLKHYQVPAGAYPTSSPYTHFAGAEAPEYSKADVSSTAADILAHPFTTRAPQSRSGGAPGRRGGGCGDKEGTKQGVGRLGDRKPQSDGPVASKSGVQNAWKMRI